MDDVILSPGRRRSSHHPLWHPSTLLSSTGASACPWRNRTRPGRSPWCAPEEGSALSQRRSAPWPDSTARLQIRQSRSIRCDLSEKSRRRARRRPGESLLALSCCCSWCPSLNHTAGSLDRARLRLRPALAESPVPSSSATHPRLRPGSTRRRSTRHTLVSRHGSDVVGCAQPSERSARRIAQPIPSVLASDATPRCASMASADRQMIGHATLAAHPARPIHPPPSLCTLPPP